MNLRSLAFVAVILAAGTAGFLAYRFSDTGNGVEAPSAAPPSTGVEPEPATAGTPIPERLPDVTLPDREGKPRSMSEWKDRPLVVNFWATWCAPCRKEIPLLEELRAERAADRLEIVGIAVDNREEVLRFADEIGIDYPVLIAEENGFEVTQKFGVVMAFPVSVFADRNARIVAVKVGELHRDEAELILDRVRDVDSGRLPLADARKQIESGLEGLAAARRATEKT